MKQSVVKVLSLLSLLTHDAVTNVMTRHDGLNGCKEWTLIFNQIEKYNGISLNLLEKAVNYKANKGKSLAERKFSWDLGPHIGPGAWGISYLWYCA
ncbi:hypothetical protein HAX54_033007 [Datura stramonium]|uniref:Uncharacterized protein n=1 Tax=Datura stramonium TaxID=4076 RepID=A0ABS8SDB0_DATST|nr:hypothetical protein [Datura stramonium]